MTADEKAQRDAGCPRDDQIGKAFVVVGRNVRRCLVCEELFTRRTASEHAKVDCYPLLELSAVYPSKGGKDVA
ncbi:MAG: hypothetical protein ACLPLR_01900 [Terriglobales bacterium]